MEKIKPSDKVRVKTEGEDILGVLMPTENQEFTFIKLDSGYNIGISNSKIIKIELVEKYEPPKIEKEETFGSDKNKPTIAILHTGGTIASKVDYRTGGVVARFEPDELMALFPELKEIANIKSKLISQMFSEDMRLEHYDLMTKSIEEEVKNGADGIILTHGTDTMTYTAAALAFALEDIPIPVILVGAQRSSDRGSSDAAANLICAAEFITKTDFSGVAICMHESMEDKNCLILPACKTRKLHASRRDAFQVVNDKPIARIEFETKKITFMKKDYQKKDKKRKLKLKYKFEKRVAILRIHPGMFPTQFEFYKNAGFRGLVIEGTGLGHAPIGVPNDLCRIHKENLKAIQELISEGCTVVMTSQTIFGRVDMNVYSNGRDLLAAGVIPGEDMLPETAFIKLSWLLGNFSEEEAKKLITQNLRGEINLRILSSEYLKLEKDG